MSLSSIPLAPADLELIAQLKSKLQYAELRIRVLEERLRLLRIEKYGAGGEKLSQAPDSVGRHGINETWRPATLADLIAHYTEKELPEKASSTAMVYRSYLRTWVLPHWGPRKLFEVKTVAVEEWLRGLPLANGSKVKLRNVMHAV